MEFKDLLDPRDTVMEHKFEFSFDIEDEKLLKKDENILESRLYQEIKNKIKHFLTEAIGNVVSAGFKYLCKKDLETNEAK